MDSLAEGNQYELQLKDKRKNDKTFVFLRLTGPAMEAIDEYLTSQDGSKKPTIQFGNNNGVISIPQSEENKRFTFNVSNVINNSESNFECVQQTEDGSIESLGSIMTRLQIHAQEASYESTRMKMANQRKKYFAKEINTVNYQTGQKVKENSSSPVVNTASLKAANGSNTLIFRNQKSIEPKSTSLKTNLDIKDVSLRDRIIHILAQRPHKKPELLLRLKKEGVLEKDRNNLTRVLGEVSVLKRDVHHLAENFWNEVKCNWKQYSKEDAKAVLEKIQYHCQNKKNPLTYENQSDNLPLKKNLNTEEISNLYQSSKKRRTSHFNGSDLEALKCNGKNKNCQSPTSPESCHSSKIKKKKKNRWKRKRNKNKKKFIDFDEPMASDNSDCIRNVINPVSPPKEPFQHMKVLNSLHHCENSNSISSQLKCPISESTESFNIDNIMNAMNSASYSENSSSVSPPLVSSNPRFHTINSVTPCDKFPISEYEMVNQVSPLLKSSSTPEPRNANSFPSPVTFTIQAQNHLKKFAIQNCETNFVSSPVISPVSEKSKLKSSPPVVEYSSPVSRSENNFNISVKSLPNVTKKICLVSPPTKSPDPKNSDLVNQNNVTNFLSEKISFSSQVSTHTESSGSDVEVNISNQNHIHLKGFEQKIINTHQSPSGANRSIDPVQLLYKIKSYISDALEHGIEDSKQGFIDKESTMMCDKPDSHEQNSNFKDVHVACAVSETMCKNTNMVPAHSPHPKNSDLVSQINLTNFLSENNFSTQVPSHTESSGSEFEVNISNQNHIHLKGFEQKIINMHQSLSVADRPIDPVQCKIKSYIPDALKHGIWDSNEATKESTVMCVKPQSQLENTNFEEFHVACVSETIGKDTSMVPAQKSNMLSDKQGNEIQNVNFENPFSFHHTTKLRMYDTCEKPTENCSMQCDVPGSKMQTPNSIAEFRVKNTNQVPMEVSSLQINYPESKKQDTNLAPTEEYMQTTNFKNSFMVHNTKLAMVDSIQVSTKESNMQCDKQESEMQVSVPDPMEVCSLQEDNPENQMQGLSQAPTERCNLLYKSNSEMQTPKSKNSFMTHHNAPVVMCDSNQSPVIEESCLQCDKPKNKKQDPKNYFVTHKDAEFRLQNAKEICREKDLNIQCDESSSNLLLDTNFIESLMEWEPTKWHVFPNLAADPDKDQDFKKYYVKITSMDQRNAYKAYFNIAYELYCDLWKSVKNAFDRVKSIENVLKIYQEGTYEHERIASLLHNVYSKYLQDPSFSSAICKRDFLHEKLCHIKKLIIEFDIENEH